MRVRKINLFANTRINEHQQFSYEKRDIFSHQNQCSSVERKRKIGRKDEQLQEKVKRKQSHNSLQPEFIYKLSTFSGL